MAQSSLDKQLDLAIGNLVIVIGKVLKSVWYGCKKLRGRNIIPFMLWIILAVIGWIRWEQIASILDVLDMPGWMQKILYILILLSPAIDLALLGSVITRKQMEFYRKFEEIGFKEKTGKYPLYLGEVEEPDGRICYTFRSNISIGEWKKRAEQIETVLDCTILRIENKGSKRVIQMLAVSSEYKIPDKLLWDEGYLSNEDGVCVIGQGMLSQISFNLNRTPHVLAAGETGSGKSVILRCCLWQLINQDARVYMIDFKGGVEFGLDYERYGEVITDRERAAEVLEMLVKENTERLALFRKLRVKNLPEYNKKTGKNLCRIGVFCDEIAEMLDKKGVPTKEREIYERLEGYISTLARLSRATGINLFLGVQRPDANVLTGQIKNNIPIRICGRFADKSASEIVLNSTAAINLPDIKGRFLYLQGNELIEFQAYYFDDETMLDESVEVSPGSMLTESYTVNHHEEEIKAPYKSKNVTEEIKQVNYEEYDFNFGEDEEIEWSVDK